MGDRQYVKSLIREGQRFDEVFLLAEKELRTTKNGKLFVSGVLQDRTGQCRMIIWEATETFYEALPRGGFTRARGRVELYQNKPQLVIESCLPIADSEVELAEFLPGTKNDVKAMEKELRQILAEIKDPGLAALAQAFLDDKNIMIAFRRAPAAKVLHHAYIGGLLEHTLGVARLVRQTAPLYPFLNVDLLTLGAFLHDIGKVIELSYVKEFGYTDCGQLVGHLVQGVLLIHEKLKVLAAAGTVLPEIMVHQIEHLILAHHGAYEFGSPKLPMTAEAVALNFLDNMDAKLVAFTQAVADHPANEESWTTRQFMFENQMLFRGTAEERLRRGIGVSNGAPAEAEDGPPPRKGGLD